MSRLRHEFKPDGTVNLVGPGKPSQLSRDVVDLHNGMIELVLQLARNPEKFDNKSPEELPPAVAALVASIATREKGRLQEYEAKLASALEAHKISVQMDQDDLKLENDQLAGQNAAHKRLDAYLVDLQGELATNLTLLPTVAGNSCLTKEVRFGDLNVTIEVATAVDPSGDVIEVVTTRDCAVQLKKLILAVRTSTEDPTGLTPLGRMELRRHKMALTPEGYAELSKNHTPGELGEIYVNLPAARQSFDIEKFRNTVLPHEFEVARGGRYVGVTITGTKQILGRVAVKEVDGEGDDSAIVRDDC